MDAAFWHQRWAAAQIGFHEGRANRMLVAHFGALGLGAGARVFVPLCGKTRDVGWLLGRGHPVVGVELSRVAVEQLFDEIGVAPEVAAADPLERFAAEGVEVYVGDVFALTRAQVGTVGATYDRAALVALPAALRERYAAQVQAVTGGARQLLVTFEYDQRLRDGPPFSVDGAELARLYGAGRARELARAEVPGGLGGTVPAMEVAWLLG